jgi:phosphotransferase system enzyme I (PtsI)
MVTVPDEFVRARDFVIAAAQAAGLARTPPLGIMLEVPAAAYACDEFVRAGASFISLGTNDLAQYFFASSRLVVGDAIEPATNAAFRTFLRAAIGRAKAAGLEVGVCGEAAGSPQMTEFWLACGVDELSVAPGLVPWVKQRLRGASLQSPEPAFNRSDHEEAYRPH